MRQQLSIRNQVHALAYDKRNYHWFVVSTVCIGAFMAALDASIVNIALPRLQGEFRIGMEQVEWISLVYLLTLASSLVLFGRLADMKGRSWMYTSGFVLFAASSLFCGLADSFPVLLATRIFQAVGAAMLQANSVSIITAVTPESSRGKAIGIQASAQGIGLTLGPPIGGVLLTYLDWRWLFLVNVPVGLIGISMALLFLPKDRKNSRQESFDWPGALILGVLLVAATYFFNRAAAFDWSTNEPWIFLLVIVLGWHSFILAERKAKQPLMELSLFRIRAFTLGNLTGALSYAVMYAVLFLAPYMMEHLFGWSTFASGFMLTFIPLGMTFITPLSGAIADKYGIRLPTTAGMLIATLGCFLVAFAGEGAGASLIAFVAGLLLVGIGIGMFTPPNNSGVMGSILKSRLGIAGGFLNMSRTIGMNFGIALGGLTFRAMMGIVPAKAADSLDHAFHLAFLAFAVLASINTLIVLSNKNTDRDPDYFLGDGI